MPFLTIGGSKSYRLFYVIGGIIVAFIFGLISLVPGKLFVFFLLLANASIIIYLIRFLLGIISFWLIEATSIFEVFLRLSDFLAGGWLPLAFLPLAIQPLLRSLPFYLTIGFPAEYFQGKLSSPQVWLFFFQQFFWIVVLSFLISFFWKKGVRRYEAVGH